MWPQLLIRPRIVRFGRNFPVALFFIDTILFLSKHLLFSWTVQPLHRIQPLHSISSPWIPSMVCFWPLCGFTSAPHTILAEASSTMNTNLLQANNGANVYVYWPQVCPRLLLTSGPLYWAKIWGVLRALNLFMWTKTMFDSNQSSSLSRGALKRVLFLFVQPAIITSRRQIVIFHTRDLSCDTLPF